MLTNMFSKKGMRTDQVVDIVSHSQLPTELCNLMYLCNYGLKHFFYILCEILDTYSKRCQERDK